VGSTQYSHTERELRGLAEGGLGLAQHRLDALGSGVEVAGEGAEVVADVVFHDSVVVDYLGAHGRVVGGDLLANGPNSGGSGVDRVGEHAGRGAGGE
jgi:hypothetical protein